MSAWRVILGAVRGVPTVKFTVCLLCKQELKPHERAEGYCDACLRVRQTQPTMPTGEPAFIRGGDLERLDIPRPKP